MLGLNVMRKAIIAIVGILPTSLVLAACGGQDFQERLVETVIVKVVVTLPPTTNTPLPTYTPYPTLTTAPTPRTKTIYKDIMCDQELTDTFKMEYSDIQTISSRLQSYVAGLPDVQRISYTYRTTVWNNAQSKLHGVMYTSKEDGKQYAMQFLVYVDELGWTPSTFYIDQQCWLDAP